MPCSISIDTVGDSVRLRVSSNLEPTPPTNKHFSLASPMTHLFSSHQRPIPHLLHPDVEGPSLEPNAPYTITFTSPQSVLSEGVEVPRKTSGLTYIFSDKTDRIRLCEHITGKRLLAHIGCNRIIYDGKQVAAMCALALWCDELCGAYSISLFPNLLKTKPSSPPPVDIELIVLGLWQAKEAERKGTKSISLAVLDMHGTSERERADRRPSIASASSGSTSSSGGSSSNGKVSGRRKCTVEFTRLEDRAALLDWIR